MFRGLGAGNGGSSPVRAVLGRWGLGDGSGGAFEEKEKGCSEQCWTTSWLERLGQSQGAQVKMATIGAREKSWGLEENSRFSKRLGSGPGSATWLGLAP